MLVPTFKNLKHRYLQDFLIDTWKNYGKEHEAKQQNFILVVRVDFEQVWPSFLV